MDRKIKQSLWEILEGTGQNRATRVFVILIVGLIILNVVAVLFETVKSFSTGHTVWFKEFEIFSVAVFTVEYVLRVWASGAEERYQRPIMGRLRFMLTPFALVGLLAILPFYAPMLIPLDLRFIRVVRIFRLFRLFKIGRYSESLKTLGNVLREKWDDLLMTIFVVFILLIITSTLMYHAECNAQPECFSSIPATMWWATATLTNVGSVDFHPMTLWGKVLGAVIGFLGIGLFALPAGILGSGFIEEIQKKKHPKKTCPHCGKEI
jgi:voltage-gated potassium channel